MTRNGDGLAVALERVVVGDATAVNLLQQPSHDELQAAWLRSSRPRVTTNAVHRVLRALLEMSISAADAVAWAKLVDLGTSRPNVVGCARSTSSGPTKMKRRLRN
jgi:hypothetical protein